MTDHLSRTRDEAEAFLKLQEAATEGPWETLPPTPGDYDDKYSVIMARGKGEIGYCPIAEQMAQEQHKENAELLVAARNTALPRLTLELAAENERLRIALHDAIRRPMGTVPDSALEFYSPQMAEEAEERRSKLPQPPDGTDCPTWERREGERG